MWHTSLMWPHPSDFSEGCGPHKTIAHHLAFWETQCANFEDHLCKCSISTTFGPTFYAGSMQKLVMWVSLII